jgi:hypothetical protein
MQEHQLYSNRQDITQTKYKLMIPFYKIEGVVFEEHKPLNQE